ncbi:hypothetical protein BJ138DRAFT_1101590 [Hygrophoropsis aurantiaca]|uniref:Uncharacterized protein n=1 Tax=Hygrophoropsis aurantiaca TaxID=72124 RepID=A0ACB8ADK3_9AGAM|nr:hypothetical protein BJ138DRAFT_1101590 [Hygrophoropsis aurantiaca]
MLILGSLLPVALLATLTAAQIVFNIPVAGTTLVAGSNYTFQVGMPDQPTTDDEIAIAIGLISCPNGQCPYPDYEALGQVLYQGPFDPQFGPAYYNLYQNFTVQIPASFPTGQALLGAVHFVLIGAEYSPYIEAINETVYIS